MPAVRSARAVLVIGIAATPRMLLGGAVTLAGVLIVLVREKRLIDTGT